jgi:isocitrate/isopropylmalate dehydrogenase
MMLQHVGEEEAAGRIRAALARTLARPSGRTKDLGGTATTTSFAGTICAML